MMYYHDLVQGSPEWDAFRLRHFGASEAAAMLGLSPKTTRNELLRAKASGNPKVFSQYVQEKILDRGHELEALARPIVSKHIGRKLYPVTVTETEDSVESASCDGLTMDEEDALEHKQWNEELVAYLRENGVPPDEHMPQCQQILMITGAKRVHFVVSDGTSHNMEIVIVLPDPEWFERIRAGWAQFAKDLDNYQHVVDVQKPEGRAPEDLPALRIELVGKVTTTNLNEFHGHALSVIGAINTDLQTDEDFANAEKAVKWCKGVETSLEAAKQHALSQTADIDKLFRTIDSIREETRIKRLELDKLVTTRKESIRYELVNETAEKYEQHVISLEAEIKGVRLRPLLTFPVFSGVIKNLRTVTSIRNALDTALANAKIEADKMAKDVRTKLAWCADNAAGYGSLFPDLPGLMRHDMDAFQAVIKGRIADHERELAERERARQEQKEELLGEAETILPAVPELAPRIMKPDHARNASKPPVAEKIDRPSDAEIIKAVAKAFGVETEKAQYWIVEVAENVINSAA